MFNKVFSGVEDLPQGTASDQICPGCLVLEGGAFRGVYTSGVLDALMEAGINFQCTVGVSAGALNRVNYVAGQIGRAARINLMYRHDSRYVGLTALRHNRGPIGFDFVFDQVNQELPFDEARFYHPARRFVAVATNCRTGQPVYFEKGLFRDIFGAVRASASMPYVSRPVMLEGTPYLDGGCSVKIPYAWAMAQGYEKILVVRSRTADFRYPPQERPSPASQVYRRYPKLARQLDLGHSRYNTDCQTLSQLHRAGRLFMIAPSKDPDVLRLEPDMEKLGKLYYLGYQDGQNALPALKRYLHR